jgi:hypothetical protein
MKQPEEAYISIDRDSLMLKSGDLFVIDKNGRRISADAILIALSDYYGKPLLNKCHTCGQQFVGPTWARYCASCRIERKREIMRRCCDKRRRAQGRSKKRLKILEITTDAEKIAMLGTMSDAQLGDMWGISSTSVANMRKERGIPSHKVRNVVAWDVWDEQLKDLTMTSSGIARLIGCEASTVRERRRYLLRGEGIYARHVPTSGVVEDIYGMEFDVRERRPTKYGFEVLFGWPAGTVSRARAPRRRVIITKELAAYMESMKSRPSEIDLPLGENSAVTRIRKFLGLTKETKN